jgi:hypothetical protein
MNDIDEYNGFGTEPATGEPISGPTLLPTWWIGQVPVVIPIDGWESLALTEEEPPHHD